MDIFDKELIRFWKILNKHKVNYIMVGGFAVNMNGYIRATSDSDMWLKDELSNRKNLRKAFDELEYGDFSSFETIQFVPGFTQFYIANGIILDIMTSMKGLENYSFDECHQQATIADLEGVEVPFLHLNHLIENKKAVNRSKDQVDVIELEKIKKYLKENNKKD